MGLATDYVFQHRFNGEQPPASNPRPGLGVKQATRKNKDIVASTWADAVQEGGAHLAPGSGGVAAEAALVSVWQTATPGGHRLLPLVVRRHAAGFDDVSGTSRVRRFV